MSDQTGLRLVALATDGPGTVKLDGVAQTSITAALSAAVPGQTIEVGRGRYTGATESFPLRVPAGVTVTGPEPRKIPDAAKKFLPTPPPAEIVASSCAIEVAGDDVRLAHLTIRNLRRRGGEALAFEGAARIVVDTCEVAGSVRVTGAQDVRLVWCDIGQGSVVVDRTDTFVVTGGTITGTHGSDALVRITDSTDVRIEAAALPDAGTGVVAERCNNVLIGGCAVLAEGDAVHVADSTSVTVSGNRLRGRRAVHLVGCTDGDVSANGIEHAVTAIGLQQCRAVTVGFNHIAEADVEVAETTD